MQRREDLLKITNQIIDSNELLRGVSFLYFGKRENMVKSEEQKESKTR
jgi:hypothetical protein